MPSASLTGIDIGSTAIRVVEMSKSRKKISAANFGQAPLPPGAVEGGLILDAQLVTTTLKSLWREHKFRNKNVVLGVTGAQVLVRQMTLPALPPKELRAVLPFEVQEILPMPVDKALLDFYALGVPSEENTVEGLVIAAPKDSVLTTVRAVERAGLHVKRVDLASFAMLRSGALLAAPVEAVVDIGARATTVVVHAAGRPLIVRTVPRGGADVTDAISERLNIQRDHAELLKMEHGLHMPLPGETQVPPQLPQVVAEAVRPLVSEIRSSVAYVKSIDPQAQVASVSLSGGGALLPGLVQALDQELGIAVLLADPLERLNESKRGKHNELARHRSAAAVCVGLTLAAA